MDRCKAQTEYLRKIGELQEICADLLLPEELLRNEAKLYDELKETRLAIPVIGAFSSGKSTLLNTLMEIDELLPTAITPETSLALELHDGYPARLEAVDVEGKDVRFMPTELAGISKDANKWAYGKIFIENQALKAMEPFYLVDMPGMSSPNEAHNAAILRYLDKGVHYIALVDAAQRTINSAFLRKLQEIAANGTRFHVFLSKADLVDKETLEKITAHLRKLLKYNFPFEVPVAAIDCSSTEDVTSALQSLDADSVFVRKWHDPMGNAMGKAIESINFELLAISKSKDELDRIIAELENAASAVEKESRRKLLEIEDKGLSGDINHITRQLRDQLNYAIPEVVAALMEGKRQDAESIMNDVTRATLTEAIQKCLGELSQEVCIAFSVPLSGLESTMSEVAAEHRMQDKVASKLRSYLPGAGDSNSAQDIAGEKIARLAGVFSAASKTAGVVATGFLAPVANIAAPVLGALIAFLPELLSGLLRQKRRQDMREALAEQLRAEIVPSILAKVRRELPNQLAAHYAALVEKVRNTIEEDIALKKQAAQNALSEQSDSRASLAQKNQRLLAARDRIVRMMDELA